MKTFTLEFQMSFQSTFCLMFLSAFMFVELFLTIWHTYYYICRSRPNASPRSQHPEQTCATKLELDAENWYSFQRPDWRVLCPEPRASSASTRSSYGYGRIRNWQ
ncbi:hypothetical protein BDY21DRAFT_332783 [Lineolata rhizophorae]|uniref:Uncharacterized protein n=1 Tax=Lineolata rhizophorae TaxID=578093 RepID=A0A6A6PCV3_9PEZI|nr:hypothetical protein BDY21DRAFT_332783 [Lineolata rhizophorae]